MQLNGFYTGIGSRQINRYFSRELVALAYVMAFNGMCHRSGGALGSDLSHHIGALIACRVMRSLGFDVADRDFTVAYLPWSGFNGIPQEWSVVLREDWARELAAQYHPSWGKLSSAAQKLMQRNVHQIMGSDGEQLSSYLCAFTPDGAEERTTRNTGGTGQAIRIAIDKGVPVRNIGNPETRQRMAHWVQEQLDSIDKKFGIDSRQLIEFHIVTDKPNGAVWRYGDIAREFETGEYDAVIHLCNCQNTMGSGVAKALAQRFDGLQEVDRRKGRGRKLLGDFSVLNTQFGSIYNLYGQERWGRDKNVLYADYQMIHKGLKAISPFVRNKKVLIPRLGAGTANACWLSISQILRQFPEWDLTIVSDPQPRL